MKSIWIVFVIQHVIEFSLTLFHLSVALMIAASARNPKSLFRGAFYTLYLVQSAADIFGFLTVSQHKPFATEQRYNPLSALHLHETDGIRSDVFRQPGTD